MILLPKPGPEASILSNGTTIHPHKKAERQKSFLTISLSYINQSRSFLRTYLFYLLFIFLYLYYYLFLFLFIYIILLLYLCLFIFLFVIYIYIFVILFFIYIILLPRFIFFNLSIFFPSLLPPQRKIHNLLLWLFHFLSWAKPLKWFSHPTLSFSNPFSTFYKNDSKCMQCTLITLPPPLFPPLLLWMACSFLQWVESCPSFLKCGFFLGSSSSGLFLSCIWAIFLPTIVSVFPKH